jgi:hypothetical protein
MCSIFSAQSSSREDIEQARIDRDLCRPRCYQPGCPQLSQKTVVEGDLMNGWEMLLRTDSNLCRFLFSIEVFGRCF